MLDKLFPRQVNNDYQGNLIAKWFLVALTVVTVARSLIHLFIPDGAAQTVATIPLSSFSHNAAAAVVLLFALWGLSQLLMSLIYIVVLWRYQVLIPFMYVIVILEYSVRVYLIDYKHLHVLVRAPGHVADYIIVPLAILMFIFSLRKPQNSVAAP